MASGVSKSARPFPITSSIRYFDVAGRMRPETRLTSIRAMPTPRRPRRAQMRALASCHAADVIFFFFGASFTSATGDPRRCPRVPSDFGSRSPIPIATLSEHLSFSFQLPASGFQSLLYDADPE